MAKKITIRGIIGLSEQATPEFLARELLGADDVEIKCASPGGLVFAGIEMGNMILRHPGHTTATMTGLAASMSAHIPMKADVVLAEDDAVFMIHNVIGGMMGGDFRDANKLSARLEALRDLLAKAFTNKTGKELSEIQELMNDESFFFGDEIVSEGFADALVPSSAKDDSQDKETALALAQAEIQSCINTLNENESKVNADNDQATAYSNMLTNHIPEKHNKQPPAAAGKQEEVQKMDLTELLAANPAAKAQYDANMKASTDSARAEGVSAGKETMNEAFTAALPILSSDKYPDTVKERVSAKAKDGDIEGLKDFVAIHDMAVEANKGEQAGAEQGKETPGQGGSESKAQKSESDFQARLDSKGRA